MTPDEVVNNLIEYGTIKALSSNEGSNDPVVVMLQSAITLLQDYQKLREKLTVDKIDEIVQNTIEGIVTKNKNVHNEDKFFEVLNEVGIVQGIAKEIVTYLQQPTEH